VEHEHLHRQGTQADDLSDSMALTTRRGVGGEGEDLALVRRHHKGTDRR
jgi:hypothetical protein